MPQTVSPEGMADSEGPNASMQFGQVGQAQQLANSLKSTNPGAYNGSQEPNPAGQGGNTPLPVSGQPNNPQGPPVQPPPVQAEPLTPAMPAPYPWRQKLQVWAQHPKAGPYTKTLAELARRGTSQGQGQ